MGLYKFYLGTHKSGKKEKRSTIKPFCPAASVMPKLQFDLFFTTTLKITEEIFVKIC